MPPLKCVRFISLRAENLIPQDGRSCDPYVVVRMGERVLKTERVARNHVNPSWRQLELFYFPWDGVTSLPEVEFTVVDFDNLGSHDFLGYARVQLHKMMIGTGAEVRVRLGTRNERDARLLQDHSTLGYILFRLDQGPPPTASAGEVSAPVSSNVRTVVKDDQLPSPRPPNQTSSQTTAVPALALQQDELVRRSPAVIPVASESRVVTSPMNPTPSLREGFESGKTDTFATALPALEDGEGAPIGVRHPAHISLASPSLAAPNVDALTPSANDKHPSLTSNAFVVPEIKVVAAAVSGSSVDPTKAKGGSNSEAANNKNSGLASSIREGGGGGVGGLPTSAGSAITAVARAPSVSIARPPSTPAKSKKPSPTPPPSVRPQLPPPLPSPPPLTAVMSSGGPAEIDEKGKATMPAEGNAIRSKKPPLAPPVTKISNVGGPSPHISAGAAATAADMKALLRQGADETAEEQEAVAAEKGEGEGEGEGGGSGAAMAGGGRLMGNGMLGGGGGGGGGPQLFVSNICALNVPADEGSQIKLRLTWADRGFFETEAQDWEGEEAMWEDLEGAPNLCSAAAEVDVKIEVLAKSDGDADFVAIVHVSASFGAAQVGVDTRLDCEPTPEGLKRTPDAATWGCITVELGRTGNGEGSSDGMGGGGGGAGGGGLTLSTPTNGLALKLISADDLIAGDQDDTSDPYAIIYAVDVNERMEEVGRTRTIRSTLTPKWNETFRFPDVSPTIAYFQIIVYDEDPSAGAGVGGAALGNFLGQCRFQFRECPLRMILQLKLLPRRDNQADYRQLQRLGRPEYGTVMVEWALDPQISSGYKERSQSTLRTADFIDEEAIAKAAAAAAAAASAAAAAAEKKKRKRKKKDEVSQSKELPATSFNLESNPVTSVNAEDYADEEEGEDEDDSDGESSSSSSSSASSSSVCSSEVRTTKEVASSFPKGVAQPPDIMPAATTAADSQQSALASLEETMNRHSLAASTLSAAPRLALRPGEPFRFVVTLLSVANISPRCLPCRPYAILSINGEEISSYTCMVSAAPATASAAPATTRAVGRGVPFATHKMSSSPLSSSFVVWNFTFDTRVMHLLAGVPTVRLVDMDTRRVLGVATVPQFASVGLRVSGGASSSNTQTYVIPFLSPAQSTEGEQHSGRRQHQQQPPTVVVADLTLIITRARGSVQLPPPPLSPSIALHTQRIRDGTAVTMDSNSKTSTSLSLLSVVMGGPTEREVRDSIKRARSAEAFVTLKVLDAFSFPASVLYRRERGPQVGGGRDPTHLFNTASAGRSTYPPFFEGSNITNNSNNNNNPHYSNSNSNSNAAHGTAAGDGYINAALSCLDRIVPCTSEIEEEGLYADDADAGEERSAMNEYGEPIPAPPPPPVLFNPYVSITIVNDTPSLSPPFVPPLPPAVSSAPPHYHDNHFGGGGGSSGGYAATSLSMRRTGEERNERTTDPFLEGLLLGGEAFAWRREARTISLLRTRHPRWFYSVSVGAPPSVVAAAESANARVKQLLQDYDRSHRDEEAKKGILALLGLCDNDLNAGPVNDEGDKKGENGIKEGGGAQSRRQSVSPEAAAPLVSTKKIDNEDEADDESDDEYTDYHSTAARKRRKLKEKKRKRKAERQAKKEAKRAEKAKRKADRAMLRKRIAEEAAAKAVEAERVAIKEEYLRLLASGGLPMDPELHRLLTLETVTASAPSVAIGRTRIVFTVWDADEEGFDTFIGQAVLPINEFTTELQEMVLQLGPRGSGDSTISGGLGDIKGEEIDGVRGPLLGSLLLSRPAVGSCASRYGWGEGTSGGASHATNNNKIKVPPANNNINTNNNNAAVVAVPTCSPYGLLRIQFGAFPKDDEVDPVTSLVQAAFSTATLRESTHNNNDNTAIHHHHHHQQMDGSAEQRVAAPFPSPLPIPLSNTNRISPQQFLSPPPHFSSASNGSVEPLTPLPGFVMPLTGKVGGFTITSTNMTTTTATAGGKNNNTALSPEHNINGFPSYSSGAFYGLARPSSDRVTSHQHCCLINSFEEESTRHYGSDSGRGGGDPDFPELEPVVYEITLHEATHLMPSQRATVVAFVEDNDLARHERAAEVKGGAVGNPNNTRSTNYARGENGYGYTSYTNANNREGAWAGAGDQRRAVALNKVMVTTVVTGAADEEGAMVEMSTVARRRDERKPLFDCAPGEGGQPPSLTRIVIPATLAAVGGGNLRDPVPVGDRHVRMRALTAPNSATTAGGRRGDTRGIVGVPIRGGVGMLNDSSITTNNTSASMYLSSSHPYGAQNNMNCSASFHRRAQQQQQGFPSSSAPPVMVYSASCASWAGAGVAERITIRQPCAHRNTSFTLTLMDTDKSRDAAFLGEAAIFIRNPVDFKPKGSVLGALTYGGKEVINLSLGPRGDSRFYTNDVLAMQSACEGFGQIALSITCYTAREYELIIKRRLRAEGLQYNLMLHVAEVRDICPEGRFVVETSVAEDGKEDSEMTKMMNQERLSGAPSSCSSSLFAPQLNVPQRSPAERGQGTILFRENFTFDLFETTETIKLRLNFIPPISPIVDLRRVVEEVGRRILLRQSGLEGDERERKRAEIVDEVARRPTGSMYNEGDAFGVDQNASSYKEGGSPHILVEEELLAVLRFLWGEEEENSTITVASDERNNTVTGGNMMAVASLQFPVGPPDSPLGYNPSLAMRLEPTQTFIPLACLGVGPSPHDQAVATLLEQFEAARRASELRERKDVEEALERLAAAQRAAEEERQKRAESEKQTAAAAKKANKKASQKKKKNQINKEAAARNRGGGDELMEMPNFDDLGELDDPLELARKREAEVTAALEAEEMEEDEDDDESDEYGDDDENDKRKEGKASQIKIMENNESNEAGGDHHARRPTQVFGESGGLGDVFPSPSSPSSSYMYPHLVPGVLLAQVFCTMIGVEVPSIDFMRAHLFLSDPSHTRDSHHAAAVGSAANNNNKSGSHSSLSCFLHRYKRHLHYTALLQRLTMAYGTTAEREAHGRGRAAVVSAADFLQRTSPKALLRWRTAKVPATTKPLPGLLMPYELREFVDGANRAAAAGLSDVGGIRLKAIGGGFAEGTPAMRAELARANRELAELREALRPREIRVAVPRVENGHSLSLGADQWSAGSSSHNYYDDTGSGGGGGVFTFVGDRSTLVEAVVVEAYVHMRGDDMRSYVDQLRTSAGSHVLSPSSSSCSFLVGTTPTTPSARQHASNELEELVSGILERYGLAAVVVAAGSEPNGKRSSSSGAKEATNVYFGSQRQYERQIYQTDVGGDSEDDSLEIINTMATTEAAFASYIELRKKIGKYFYEKGAVGRTSSFKQGKRRRLANEAVDDDYEYDDAPFSAAANSNGKLSLILPNGVPISLLDESSHTMYELVEREPYTWHRQNKALLRRLQQQAVPSSEGGEGAGDADHVGSAGEWEAARNKDGDDDDDDDELLTLRLTTDIRYCATTVAYISALERFADTLGTPKTTGTTASSATKPRGRRSPRFPGNPPRYTEEGMMDDYSSSYTEDDGEEKEEEREGSGPYATINANNNINDLTMEDMVHDADFYNCRVEDIEDVFIEDAIEQQRRAAVLSNARTKDYPDQQYAIGISSSSNRSSSAYYRTSSSSSTSDVDRGITYNDDDGRRRGRGRILKKGIYASSSSPEGLMADHQRERVSPKRGKKNKSNMSREIQQKSNRQGSARNNLSTNLEDNADEAIIALFGDINALLPTENKKREAKKMMLMLRCFIRKHGLTGFARPVLRLCTQQSADSYRVTLEPPSAPTPQHNTMLPITRSEGMGTPSLIRRPAPPHAPSKMGLHVSSSSYLNSSSSLTSGGGGGRGGGNGYPHLRPHLNGSWSSSGIPAADRPTEGRRDNNNDNTPSASTLNPYTYATASTPALSRVVPFFEFFIQGPRGKLLRLMEESLEGWPSDPATAVRGTRRGDGGSGGGVEGGEWHERDGRLRLRRRGRREDERGKQNSVLRELVPVLFSEVRGYVPIFNRSAAINTKNNNVAFVENMNNTFFLATTFAAGEHVMSLIAMRRLGGNYHGDYFSSVSSNSSQSHSNHLLSSSAAGLGVPMEVRDGGILVPRVAVRRVKRLDSGYGAHNNTNLLQQTVADLSLEGRKMRGGDSLAKNGGPSFCFLRLPYDPTAVGSIFIDERSIGEDYTYGAPGCCIVSAASDLSRIGAVAAGSNNNKARGHTKGINYNKAHTNSNSEIGGASSQWERNGSALGGTTRGRQHPYLYPDEDDKYEEPPIADHRQQQERSDLYGSTYYYTNNNNTTNTTNVAKAPPPPTTIMPSTSRAARTPTSLFSTAAAAAASGSERPTSEQPLTPQPPLAALPQRNHHRPPYAAVVGSPAVADAPPFLYSAPYMLDAGSTLAPSTLTHDAPRYPSQHPSPSSYYSSSYSSRDRVGVLLHDDQQYRKKGPSLLLPSSSSTTNHNRYNSSTNKDAYDAYNDGYGYDYGVRGAVLYEEEEDEGAATDLSQKVTTTSGGSGGFSGGRGATAMASGNVFNGVAYLEDGEEVVLPTPPPERRHADFPIPVHHSRQNAYKKPNNSTNSGSGILTNLVPFPSSSSFNTGTVKNNEENTMHISGGSSGYVRTPQSSPPRGDRLLGGAAEAAGSYYYN